MKLVNILLAVLMSAVGTMYAQTITPKECNTCGKSLIQCQYKGRHPKPTSGYENGYEWVDLGLSVKWATKNVGASSPSDYGGYYAWGETSTKSRYDWNNCYDCLDGTGARWSNYCFGGLTQIAPMSGHDTARENWRGKWRMPTSEEIDELCMKCTWIWTTMNSHKGYRVTGKNGNSIFLPAAGYRYGTGTNNVEEGGYYWSSTLRSSDSSGYIYFNSNNYETYRTIRRNGQSVRPVME